MNDQSIPFGKHFMFDGYGCARQALESEQTLRRLLEDIPRDLDMHPISEPLIVSVGPNNKKDPGGLSGFVLIAESHISIHTFPRRGFVTADVYSCQDDLDGVRLEHAFTKALGATSCETFEVIRGRHYPAADVED